MPRQTPCRLRLCRALIQRTVPVAERITTLSVVM
jgi:hypothetical protein